MPTTIRVRDFRGVAQADIEIAGITLVAGLNASGKTSLLQAVAAAVTGRVIPVPGLPKKHASTLVRAGAPNGSIVISTDGGDSASITWPDGKLQTEGSPPAAGAIAAGLDRLATMSQDDRARFMIAALDAAPGKEDVAQALPDISADHVEKLWAFIEADGWDDTHARAREKGVNLKGRWEQVTGERYGSKKAATWLPDDWGDELEAASEQSLQDGLAQEREFLEGAIAAHAIDEERRRELEERAAQIEPLAETVSETDLAQQQVRSRMIAVEEELRVLPPIMMPQTQPCPHCGNDLVVDGGKIALPAKTLPTQAEIDKREAEIAAKRDELATIHAGYDKALAAWRAAQDDLAAATSAKPKLDEMRATQPAAQQGGEHGDVEKCREAVARAEARLVAFVAKREADRLHAAVDANQTIIDVLAPGGLRARKLTRAVEAFNAKHLAPLCRMAGWSDVALDDHLTPTYAGRPYMLLSASEQYRVGAVLQLAMAQIDDSALVIIDAADILDRGGRNGLLRMLIDADMDALVGMTITDPGKTPPPDLSTHGGTTYWIEDGVATDGVGPAK